jgi:hypothetical protein
MAANNAPAKTIFFNPFIVRAIIFKTDFDSLKERNGHATKLKIGLMNLLPLRKNDPI